MNNNDLYKDQDNDFLYVPPKTHCLGISGVKGQNKIILSFFANIYFLLVEEDGGDSSTHERLGDMASSQG